MSALAPLLGAERTYARRVPLLLFLQDQLRSERAQHRFNLAERERELALVLRELAEERLELARWDTIEALARARSPSLH